MKRSIVLLACLCSLYACKNTSNNNKAQQFSDIASKYWEERMQLFPMEATSNGDYRYNDKMTITIAGNFRDSLKRFYQKYIGMLVEVDTNKLNVDEQVSFRLFKYEMNMSIEGLKYPTHYMPINQFWAPTIDLAQLGSGQGNQPFKTVKDYDDFLKRLSVLPAWADTAIFNMRKGIETGWVLPKTLVVKVLPQLKSMIVKDAKESIFYGAIKLIPDSFTLADKQRLTAEYLKAIDSVVIPSYGKLYDFFEKEYMPKSRSTSGISFLPNGMEYYQYCIRYWTTTGISADSIFNIGQQEVNRLQTEMTKVKDQVGYKGN